MELLSVQNLTKTIKGKNIVDNVNFNVNSGEIVGFLGPNGAGKTTTIKMIMGLFGITKGKVNICGHDVATDFERAMSNVGAIVENPDLYKRLSGRENLKYFASFHGQEALDNIDSVVEMVKMKDRIDDKVKNYSLGMRQRVGLAQALLHMPRLLILDEPTNGLDPIGIKEMRELLKNLAANAGTGVLVSSHLLSEMELMCDRIYIIDDGKIIGEKEIKISDDTEEIYQYTFVTDNNAKVYETFKSMNTTCDNLPEGVTLVMKHKDMPKVIKMLVQDGIGIYAVNRQERTLEQDFLTMTTGTQGQIG